MDIQKFAANSGSVVKGTGAAGATTRVSASASALTLERGSTRLNRKLVERGKRLLKDILVTKIEEIIFVCFIRLILTFVQGAFLTSSRI